ncbi:helix-turn-helix domain-containing protein [Streptomyces venezuelae]|uniref:helix-turn-helix domain-containing protein n=1 Tax=Streptomyces venezuelae TaxID=54571 RepID=UPI00378CD8CA
MAEQQLNAPPCASPAIPSSGIRHINRRHPDRYTVVGNHLAQHRHLSLTAIGLATHIQSLPAGAKVTIKCLVDRFPEGEVRIAAALRELEAHGYLTRTRERLPSGRVVTRTVSYNNPDALNTTSEQRPSPPATQPKPVRPKRPAPATPTAPVPAPHTPDLDRHRTALTLLTDLRRHDPRLLLAERDVRRLAPAVAAWLERDVTPEAVRRTLTAGLPGEPIHRPAALLAHRLTALLPPPLPVAPRGPRRPDPLQNCDHCDRAFRAPEPGLCGACSTAVAGSGGDAGQTGTGGAL